MRSSSQGQRSYCRNLIAAKNGDGRGWHGHHCNTLANSIEYLKHGAFFPITGVRNIVHQDSHISLSQARFRHIMKK